MSKLPPTSWSTTFQFCTTCVVWVRCLAVSTLPQICRCVAYETRDFLWDGKLAPPACQGTTGRHDFDIRSRKQFLETVDLAREYKVLFVDYQISIICTLHPVCRVCSSLQVKKNWVLPKQCKSGQGRLIKVPFF